ncbi:glucose-6-phosphate isomerase [Nonlabens ulvanivorans]|nr:glucose-6-phosphate isomerase [Nonlabens ulvanivorans]
MLSGIFIVTINGGVELGKVLADKVLDNIENKEYAAHDSSTTGILKRFGSLNN